MRISIIIFLTSLVYTSFGQSKISVDVGINRATVNSDFFYCNCEPTNRLNLEVTLAKRINNLFDLEYGFNYSQRGTQSLIKFGDGSGDQFMLLDKNKNLFYFNYIGVPVRLMTNFKGNTIPVFKIGLTPSILTKAKNKLVKTDDFNGATFNFTSDIRKFDVSFNAFGGLQTKINKRVRLNILASLNYGLNRFNIDNNYLEGRNSFTVKGRHMWYTLSTGITYTLAK